MSWSPKARQARVADIIRVAAQMSHISEDKITGPDRHRSIVRVRQACYVVARRSGHSYPQIGRLIGGRDHSSVLHGIDTAAAIAERDDEYSAFIDALDYQSLNVVPFAPVPAAVANAVPDKVEPEAHSPFLAPVDDDDPEIPEELDGAHRFHASIALGSIKLAEALRGAM
jgi:hypothetical protein